MYPFVFGSDRQKIIYFILTVKSASPRLSIGRQVGELFLTTATSTEVALQSVRLSKNLATQTVRHTAYTCIWTYRILTSDWLYFQFRKIEQLPKEKSFSGNKCLLLTQGYFSRKEFSTSLQIFQEPVSKRHLPQKMTAKPACVFIQLQSASLPNCLSV